MANIRIKRRSTAITSSSKLLPGELALAGSNLYFGSAAGSANQEVAPTRVAKYSDIPTFKTINGTSITGSGNIAVQPVLVSGTNIKTINGTSLLGSGNITISSSGSGTSTTEYAFQQGLDANAIVNLVLTPGKSYKIAIDESIAPQNTTVSLRISTTMSDITSTNRQAWFDNTGDPVFIDIACNVDSSGHRYVAGVVNGFDNSYGDLRAKVIGSYISQTSGNVYLEIMFTDPASYGSTVRVVPC